MILVQITHSNILQEFFIKFKVYIRRVVHYP